MLVPTYLACVLLGRGLYTAWSFVSVDFVIVGVAMLARYRGGRWRAHRVIQPSAIAPRSPETSAAVELAAALASGSGVVR